MGTQPGTFAETLETGGITPRWPPAAKIGFRFVFVYFLLYLLTFPAGPILPFTEHLIEKYANLWVALIPWLGKHVLHLSYAIPTADTGSGDRTFDWVQVLCFLVLAAAATVIWSGLDRRRPSYDQLNRWLRLLARFSLATTMIVYGASKVIPLQMPAPPLSRLLQPYGDSSPMGILWTFIGASKSFEVFTGLAEMLGGVLLIFPRTTALGAVVSLADMSMVFMLNMCYDVPVKLFSFNELLFGAYLLAPDVPRLANVFLFNRTAEPAEEKPLFRRRWLNRGTLFLQAAVGLYILGSNLYGSVQQNKVYGSAAPKPPFYGVWTADEFTLDGVARPPLLTDSARWRRVLFQHFQEDLITIEPMTGPKQGFTFKLDSAKKTLALEARSDPKSHSELTFDQPAPTALILAGTVDGHQVQARLTRMDESKFLLKSRGFHWVQESPFNR